MLAYTICVHTNYEFRHPKLRSLVAGAYPRYAIMGSKMKHMLRMYEAWLSSHMKRKALPCMKEMKIHKKAAAPILMQRLEMVLT